MAPKSLTDVKTLDQFGEFVGLAPGEGKAILAAVRENHARLSACTRHQFPKPEVLKFNQKHICNHCLGEMSGSQVARYEEGVRHCGSPFEVWVDSVSPSA